MAKDNGLTKPRQPNRVAHRRTLSSPSRIPVPSSSINPLMSPGPVRKRASQSTFFEGSRDVRMSGPTNFNSGQDHHHTVGNNNIVIHLHGESGIKHALGLGILQSERPIRISRSNPTSGVNSPKVSPYFNADFVQSPGDEAPKGAPVEDLRAQTIDANRHFETYYRHLLAKQRGFPLWIPEPNDVLPVEYRRRGIDIGDVGIFMDNGGFVHLFNICVAKDHPINPNSIPDDFLPSDPLGFQPSDFRECPVLGPNDYLASSVMKTNSSPLTFVSTDSEGAVLVVPNGSKSYDLQNLTAFIKYASANAKDWYRYAKQMLGFPAKNGDLRLVVGHDKATAWGLMSFSNLHELESFRFRLIPKPVDQSGEIYQWEYLENRRAEARYGPDVRGIEGLRGSDETDGSMVALENQCLFARTLNITFHHDVWATLVAEGIGGSDSTDSLRSFEEHPSKAINDLLLKSRPDAKLAITQDWDWISVIQTTEHILPPYEILFTRILETHAICECNGAVFLQSKSVNETPQVVPGNVPIHDDTSSMIEEIRRKQEDLRRKEQQMKQREEKLIWREEEERKRTDEAWRKAKDGKATVTLADDIPSPAPKYFTTQIGRRSRSASIRSKASGASTLPFITETSAERVDDVEAIMEGESVKRNYDHDKRKSTNTVENEEKQSARRRDSRSSFPLRHPLLRSSSVGSSSTTIQYAMDPSSSIPPLSSQSSFVGPDDRDRYHAAERPPLKPQQSNNIERRPPSRDAPYLHRDSSFSVREGSPPSARPMSARPTHDEWDSALPYPGGRLISSKPSFPGDRDYARSPHPPISRKSSFKYRERERERDMERDRERERERDMYADARPNYKAAYTIAENHGLDLEGLPLALPQTAFDS